MVGRSSRQRTGTEQEYVTGPKQPSSSWKEHLTYNGKLCYSLAHRPARGSRSWRQNIYSKPKPPPPSANNSNPPKFLMLLHTSHQPHQSNSTQANRKRKHGVVADSADPFTFKRPRSTHPLHFNLISLPAEDRYQQAADLLDAPVNYLREAFPGLEEQDPGNLLPYNDWQPLPYPRRMKRSTGRGRSTPKPPSTGSISEEAQDGDVNNYTGGQGEKLALQWSGQMDGSSDFPEPARQGGRDSTFCFPKEVIVDFFSNLCSVDDAPSRGNRYGKLIGEIGRR